MTIKQSWATLLFLIIIGASYSATVEAFVDEDGCLLCHKYPKMGRVTEDGAQRSYYVMPHVFGKTVHRNVPCRDCHNYIEELPHQEVETGVSCNTECHSVKNPATGKNFSHKPIYDAYRDSVHGREKITSEIESDKPYCITCQTNPIYNPKEESIPTRVTDRCVICHEDREFVESWYSHTSRRIREVKRSSIEIVELCSSCHEDQSMIDRRMKAAQASGEELGKKFPVAATTYKDSFHGKVTRYGFTEAANCLDCHADYENYYLSVHEIHPSRDPLSPMHKDNRVQTCQRCHEYANENYATIDPHPTKDLESNPFIYYAEEIYNLIAYVVIAGLIALALFETIGRRRDGVSWQLRHGSSWWRSNRKRKDRDRVT
jgi:hypothetical protein